MSRAGSTVNSMGKNTNAARAAQLGMSWGAACGLLRKLVLFAVLKRHGENVCFRCEQPIESADDLTIEHKQPWLHISPELFWDLDNVAFSHRTCNKVDRYNGGGKHLRKVAPEGMAWCSTCKQFKPEDEFSRNAKRFNGRNWECRSCKDRWR
jgi:hypothetical protein